MIVAIRVHAHPAGGPIIVAKGWPHDRGETARSWPHVRGDWHAACHSLLAVGGASVGRNLAQWGARRSDGGVAIR